MFWCYMAVARAALSHSSETGEARASQPTQTDATDRPGARVQGSHRDGSSRPLAGFALMHAARRARRLGKHLLRKLTARSSLLCVRGRRVLPRHGYRTVLGVVLGDLVDRVLRTRFHELVVRFLTVEPLQ